MPNQPSISPLAEFLQELSRQKIRCILIGMMAAVEQGAPLATIDFDFWVDLPKRQIVRIYEILGRTGGTLMAPTFYELRDGTQVNLVFEPSGLQSFAVEYARSRQLKLAGFSIRVLPLSRVIASKRAAARDKDKQALPVLERTLKLRRKLDRKSGKNAPRRA